jgi:xanthine dehydrogenase accessory factor
LRGAIWITKPIARDPRDTAYAEAVDGDLRGLGTALRALARDGVAVVRVLERHGFGTVESGQLIAGTASGTVAGVLYRGALDSTAVPLVAAAVAEPQTRDAHVPEPAALEAGLACAGGATLLGHPLSAECAEALGAALERGTPRRPRRHPRRLRRDGAHRTRAGRRHRQPRQRGARQRSRRHRRARLRRGATVTERTEEFLLDLWVPVPSVLIVGSGAIGARSPRRPRCSAGRRGPSRISTRPSPRSPPSPTPTSWSSSTTARSSTPR